MSNEAPRHFESKMTGTCNRVLLNTFLAIIIFYFAEMSRLLGLHGLPLAVSAVWPATGFSLAAILLFGYGMSPGILIGNLCYNFFHLSAYGNSPILAFATSFIIAAGSLLESVVAAYIMRRRSSPNYFSSVKDVIIFLLPASVFGCLIAATIGTAALLAFGNLSLHKFLPLWTAFFIGDLMGIYIFTPLIIVWLTSQPIIKLKTYHKEALLMLVLFLIISYLNFIKNYPVGHLYIPLAMWISYRFRLHGATIAIFVISIVAIGFTSMGVGSIVPKMLPTDRLTLLVSFLEIVVAISLLVSTLTNERESVIQLLEHQNIDLRQTMQLHIEAIKEMAKEVAIKKKLSSLGLITTNWAGHLHMPVNKMTASAKACLISLQELENVRQKEGNSNDPILKICERIFRNLNTICDFGSNAEAITTIIQVQSAFSTPKKTLAKEMHLNTLLNMSLNQASQKMNVLYPEFSFVLNRDFDKSITTFFILPEDLTYVFMKLFENAFHSMQKKMDLQKPGYIARLDVQSIDHGSRIEIIVQDNGLGMTEDSAKNLFQSFMECTEAKNDMRNMGLSLARDIIVYVYEGDIRAESVEGEYLKKIVTLPKNL